MARFFLAQRNIQDNQGTITGEELTHMKRVLRLKPGDRVTLFDDAGWEHEATIRAFGDDYGKVAISKSYRSERESPLELTLALGLTKGEKMDFVIEKATELGVRAIAPFVSRYTVPKLDGGKIARRAARWQKIALSAAKQSGRTHIPEVFSLTGFEELLQRPQPDALKLLFWEAESQQTLGQIHETQGNKSAILIVIGPEGGFSDEEAKKAVQAGFRTVKLGERILRAETAALAALAIVQSWWGDLG